MHFFLVGRFPWVIEKDRGMVFFGVSDLVFLVRNLDQNFLFAVLDDYQVPSEKTLLEFTLTPLDMVTEKVILIFFQGRIFPRGYHVRKGFLFE